MITRDYVCVRRLVRMVSDRCPLFGIPPLRARNYLCCMKTFTLTLYAKRKSDGTYDYSLNIWENRGGPTTEMNFESEALLRQQLDAVLPDGRDAHQILPQAQRDGDYWFPFTMPMSDAQAANLGWMGEAVPERSLVH
jgi:hypothetical protein